MGQEGGRQGVAEWYNMRLGWGVDTGQGVDRVGRRQARM